ncbi:hypothetical protein [Paractinoplanes hotanensis]|uniref:Toprim domain-containing protein n=1 Tax=Paractinoplanes hotanensis TaxID=2906497 RepID=A0ABT0Y529_9ACTN|nr:hypothetical protein [Actinoplanes hotanensis]MCM4080419.1 hypothetical protein [Actinoplanes hotanensis]
MIETAFERVISALRSQGARIVETRRRDQVTATCPAHDDHDPSLGVTDRGDRVLIVCRSNGCKAKDIVAALDLTLADLFNERPTYSKPLRYVYDDGRTVKRSYKPDGKKRIEQENTEGTPTLYHLAQLRAAPLHREIYLVEGEEDVHTLEANGIVATTAPQGAPSFHKVDVSPLAGRAVVCVVDRDEPGDGWAAQVRAKLDTIVAPGSRFVRAKVGHDTSDHFAAGLTEADFEPYEPPTVTDVAVERSRRVDLKPWLDGTYEPPQPAVGGKRGDARQMLYPGRWHTLIAPTTSGKSWWAVWHVVAELRAGHTVVYAHFEEADPGGTLDRIRMIAPDLTIDDLIERFVWLDCTRRWKGPGEFAREIPKGVALAVLDGINAACAQHGWPVDKPEAVGEYRAHFAAPVIAAGGTPLSLGHPPKARDRQDERHGYGSTAWLDEVDGVGFRLKASKESPIRRGRHGMSSLHVVKDRYGQVEQHCSTDEKASSEGWFYAGALHVDSSGAQLEVYCSAPDKAAGNDVQRSQADLLGDAVIQVLGWEMSGRFASTRSLENQLRAAGVAFRRETLDVALTILQRAGHIHWPEVPSRHPRPGVIADSGVLLAEKLGRSSASQDQKT